MIRRITTIGGGAMYHEKAVQEAIDEIQFSAELEVTKVTRVSKEGIIFGSDVTEIEYDIPFTKPINLLKDRIDYEEACDHKEMTDEQQAIFVNGMKYALDIIQNPTKYQ